MTEVLLPDNKLDWQELIDEALTMPGHMGDTYSRFARYSFMNTILLMMQGAEGPVAGYDRWRKLGRQVLRGSRAFEIIVPLNVKREDEEGQQSLLTLFKRKRCLFDYGQTTGDPLPEFDSPTWDKTRALGALGIREVAFDHLDGNIAGYSVGKDFAINPVAVHPHKTMLHEVGHIVLGHTAEDRAPEYRQHRGVFEFQAESTAYLTGHELDLLDPESASESRDYIQSWMRHERPPDPAIREVFKATDTILRAGYPDAIANGSV